jgi:heterodisulfide reductase subunit C
MGLYGAGENDFRSFIMWFKLLLYTSLIIFSLGILYKFFSWFGSNPVFKTTDSTFFIRLSAGLAGILTTIFSVKVFILLKVFIADVIFQVRTLKEDPWRWLMHILIYWGFMSLVIMHALDQIFTQRLFSDYYSTLNPYLFLRDFFAIMVMVGLGMAVYRRLIRKPSRLKSNRMDYYAIIIVAFIIVSGIFLEGLKISSFSKFQNMEKEYADLDDKNDIRALESLWVRDYGLVSATVTGPFAPDVIDHGLELNEENCLSCHASNKWAFTGYSIAVLMKPAALWFDRAGAVNILNVLHILSVFLILAYLPFSKMFHVISTPFSLLTNAVMGPEKSNSINVITRQRMELDACTHCGTCNQYCSAMMVYEAWGNPCILPSEKMTFLKSMANGKSLNQAQRGAILEGVYLCTNCDRCTVVCPAGINLKQLWLNVREELLQQGAPQPIMFSPLSLVRSLNRQDLPPETYQKPLAATSRALAGDFKVLTEPAKIFSLPIKIASGQSAGLLANNFTACFGCQTCTTSCPVVKNYENPEAELDLLPHQIMYCLASGLTEIALGSRMLWSCLTCYQCQENCPQQVQVTDIFYELKNQVVQDLAEVNTLKTMKIRAN